MVPANDSGAALLAAKDDAADPAPGGDGTAVEILAPVRQTVPLVFASPHSGRRYPADFVAASKLDPVTLRRSEDAYIEEVFAAAPGLGAPLVHATFPRAFVDANREPFELDPAMFTGPLPDYVNTASPRVMGGLGTIARVVASGDDIYADRLDFDTVKGRIARLYEPYHAALRRLIDETKRAFGACLLIDCHSMPSVGGPMDRDPGLKRVNMVLGDGHGTSCAGLITDLAERRLTEMDYIVTRNNPYAGGFTTRHYGRPGEGVHTLQIEINRALYMDEATITRGDGLTDLAARMGELIGALGTIDAERLTAP